MGRTVGIDLGTTNSLCAIFRDGRPQLVPNAVGDVLTPSVVAIPEDGPGAPVLVGAAARDVRVRFPQRTAAVFKRLMGTDRTVSVAGRTFSAPELSALVLRSLREDAEVALGEPVTDAVITVPAYFNDLQRNATKRAGEIAGLRVRRILNEPTAAALAYGFHDRDAERTLMVLDLGGGTFDATLMESYAGVLEIQGTAGESFLGGEDFSARIAAWALGQVGIQMEALELADPPRLARMLHEAERAKRALSTAESAAVRIPDEQARVHPDSRAVRISREQFAALVEPLLERIERPVRRVLADAGKQPGDVHDVILVGGATRMPLVAALARRIFEGREPISQLDPDHVVALGAAVQAALTDRDESVADLVMTDVCPFTMGVEISRRLHTEYNPGYFMPIIERNTTIPTSRVRTVQTLVAGQTSLTLRVFQGESRRVADNTLLGELLVTGIPSGPAGQSVGVRFTYDLNGILEVEAEVSRTGQRHRTVLTHHVKGLSDAEVRAALAKMQRLKSYTRDAQSDQSLLRFAERVYAELRADERSELDRMLTQFESALQQGDRVLLDAIREALLALLADCGHGYDGNS